MAKKEIYGMLLQDRISRPCENALCDLIMEEAEKAQSKEQNNSFNEKLFQLKNLPYTVSDLEGKEYLFRRIDELVDNCERILAGNPPLLYKRESRKTALTSLPYDWAFAIMKIFGYTMSDLFSKAEARGYYENFSSFLIPRVENLPKDIQEIYQMVDSLEELVRQKILLPDSACMISPRWSAIFTDKNQRASQKVISVLRMRTPRLGQSLLMAEAKKANDAESEKADPRKSYLLQLSCRTRFSMGTLNTKTYTTEELALLAEVSDVSLHWALGSPDICLYAQNKTTEQIISNYYFMAEDARFVFKTALQQLCTMIKSKEKK